jgi:hypothetical protein
MKTYKNLYPETDSDAIKDTAFRVAIKRKSSRKDVKFLIENYNKAKISLKKHLDDIVAGRLEPFVHKATEINDGFKLKKRIILQPYFSIKRIEQWIQHLIVQILKPIFIKGMYEFSCGSVPGRGVHYGKKYLEKYVKQHPDSIKYVLKADIYHFYENVNTDLLKERLKEIIKDEKFLKIVFFVLDSNVGVKKDGTIFRPGLPIGFYTSQWFANWFLQPFDHYVKEELKAGFYMRYMDDIVIFGSNKRELHKIRKNIEKYLSGMDLRLKDNWQIYRFDYTDKNGVRHGRFIDFMGFKFYRDKTTIRKTIFLRACRLARRLYKKTDLSWHDATRMLSYCGWFYPTETYTAFEKYIKTKVNIDVCKKLISKKDRRIKQ